MVEVYQIITSSYLELYDRILVSQKEATEHVTCTTHCRAIKSAPIPQIFHQISVKYFTSKYVSNSLQNLQLILHHSQQWLSQPFKLQRWLPPDCPVPRQPYSQAKAQPKKFCSLSNMKPGSQTALSLFWGRPPCAGSLVQAHASSLLLIFHWSEEQGRLTEVPGDHMPSPSAPCPCISMECSYTTGTAAILLSLCCPLNQLPG